MKLHVFRSLWGMSGRIEDQIAQIAADGYDGVEDHPNPDVISAADFRHLLDQHHLALVMGIVAETADQLDALTMIANEYHPLKIGIHGGRDSMSRAQGSAFFERALTIAAKLDIPVGFETHRGRLLYTPWDTLFYLEQFPELRIVADFSHWVNVCERLPDDQREAMQRACERAIHIHGRVGYEEGPQVPEPSAPEYARQLAWHESCWQEIRLAHQQRGESMLTFTPEYGPPAYLHTLPHTNVPVADLATICRWSADRMRVQWAAFAGESAVM